MNFEDFMTRVINAFPVGTLVKNPGGGTSLIVANKDFKITYQRGKSTMSVKLIDLFAAYEQFRGMQLTSSDLKIFRPAIFDSSARPAGHSCNCTILFRIFEKLQLCEPIEGAGVRGNPFSIKIHP
ncbi:hypothetical protein [Undibacterium aquatile]|uniref:Uncharacterized protein n=1 Tax=Undibacterium aquatile TaxID=1537398 RepID=A0ABR6XDE0_9BURK|nr:hypothetical protein [Undibacterium aquatile]MBC3810902.1 hypothetical protein [Undibacterium aquatile]